MEIVDKIVELEKTDIKHNLELKKIEEDQHRMCNELLEIKNDMNQGFKRITGWVIAAGGSIIVLLLTALCILVYDRL